MDINLDGETEIANLGKATRIQQYFAKYLTSQKLLELQLGDSNFRRYVLLQFLIMFQYLDAPVKFKQETQKLAEEQALWVSEATDRVYRLLEDTPPDGVAFAKAVHHILKREELWSNWKNEGCPEFRPLVAVPSRSEEIFNESSSGEKSTAIVSGRGRRLKRTLGEQMREASKKNKCIIGNMELTRLWNLCPDNMAACRSKERDFLPSLENYFEEAIEQLDPSIESQYKRINDANFGWRALRLLARRSLHFFTHGNSPITRLPDYLESHVKKMAKDSQIKSSSTSVNMKQDAADEAGMEQMEPEAESETATASEMEGASSAASEETVKNEESCSEDCEQNRNKKPVLCSMEQLTLLAKQLGSNWKILAPKLGFKSVEIEYFESENDSVELQARNMFQMWLENDPDASPENLLYTLEGLGLQQTAQGILS
nr:EOG090X0324 [Cyclestheria hislopi]